MVGLETSLERRWAFVALLSSRPAAGRSRKHRDADL